jgi:hypothetical protein
VAIGEAVDRVGLIKIAEAFYQESRKIHEPQHPSTSGKTNRRARRRHDPDPRQGPGH